MYQIERHPITVKFLLYGHGREEREIYPIYALIILNRKSTQLTMKMNAKPEDWDFKNGTYIHGKQYCIYANNKLNEEKNKILTAYFELKRTMDRPDLKGVVNLYKGEDMQRPDMEFLKYFQQFIDEIKLLPGQYSFGAVEHYRKTMIHLNMYLTKKGMTGVRLSELNRNFIIGLEHHLLTTPNIQHGGNPMNENTASTYLKKVKAVVNNAIKKDILTRNPFLGFQIKRNKKMVREYLNMEELEAVKKLDLSHKPRLERSRDFFMFSVYTGLRYSDAFNLKPENILEYKDGVRWLHLIQQKTKDPLDVPMLQGAVDICEKYKEECKNTGFVLPRIPHTNVNMHIKEIMRLAGVTKRISHHCMRHTFATTVTLQNGIDIKTVSRLMGHASIKATEIYSKVTTDRLLDVRKELNSKLE